MKRRLNILVTAGPTREYIDPVRFITNRATGTLGYLIAASAAVRGHKVTLISGPTFLSRPDKVEKINVRTTDDMYKAVVKQFKSADCLIMTAAVSDFRPVKKYTKKIKRDKKHLTIKLERTRDILASLKKDESKIVVGFSLETENWIENSLRKLKTKGLDLIVANRLGRSNDPFGVSRPDMVFIDSSGKKKFIRGEDKATIASTLMDNIEGIFEARWPSR